MTGVPSRSGERIGSGAGPPSLGGRPSRVGASDGVTRVGASDGSMLACVIDTVPLPSATTAGLRPEQAGPTALRRRDRLAGDDLIADVEAAQHDRVLIVCAPDSDRRRLRLTVPQDQDHCRRARVFAGCLTASLALTTSLPLPLAARRR